MQTVDPASTVLAGGEGMLAVVLLGAERLVRLQPCSEMTPRQQGPTAWHWLGIALRHRASQIPRKEMR